MKWSQSPGKKKMGSEYFGEAVIPTSTGKVFLSERQ